MAIRVDIDEQDLKRLHKETRKRFDAETITLFISCAIVGAGFVTALFFAWSRLQKLSGVGLNIETAWIAAASAAAGFCIFLGILLFRGRWAQNAMAHRETAKRGLATGRFEFHFTDKALIIKAAQATRKFAWPGLDRIAETKSNIVFWRRGKVVAFMPKDSLANPALFEKLTRLHGPAIANKLSCSDLASANPHKITFECTAADYAEYWRGYAAKRDGKLGLLRPIFHWRLWPPVLFVAALAIAVLSVYGFTTTFEIMLGALAVLSAAAAVLIFLVNPELFRGPGYPLRKEGRWPFGQSEIVSLTLFKDGVCISRGDNDEIYPWSAFEGLIIGRLAAYLALTPRDVLPAPKRAFVDKVHFQTFANYARAHMNAARNQIAARSQARLARQLSPGAKRKKPPPTRLPAPKAPTSKAPQKKLPAKTVPKALPPKRAPKALPAKSKKSAVDAVRAAAKARTVSAA